MKKSYLAIPTLLLGIMSLVGCNKGGGNSGTVIRVDTQYGKAFQTILERYAREFNAANPGITVKINQVQGTYNDLFKKEKTDMETGQGDWGDIVSCYPDHIVDYINYRRAVKVDSFLDDPEIGMTPAEYNDFTDSAKQTFETIMPATGKFVLPFSSSTECMFYNPILLTLTVPGINGGEKIDEDYINNLTWEELFDNFCPKIIDYNNSLPATEQFLNTEEDFSILSYDDDGNTFITLCEQYGYGYTSLDDSRNPSLDFNNENNRALSKKWNEYKNKNYVRTQGSMSDQRPSQTLFAKGQGLFAIGSTGGIAYLQSAIESGKQFAANCAPIPHAEGKEQMMINQGGSLCILSRDSSDNEARVKAAWQFYKYMITKTNCTLWAAQTGYAPIRKSVLTTEDWADLIDETGKDGIDLLKAKNAKYAASVSDRTFVSAVFLGSSSARQYCDGMFGKILTADTTTCTAAWVKTQYDECENNIRNDM